MLEKNNTIPVTVENVFVTKNTFAEHGNEIEEIISKQPPMIVRWGTLLLFFFLLLIGIISWFIKYPDIIQAPAKLTSINASKPVITIINGKLIKLNIAENDLVNKNQILGFIESTASHNEVIKLSSNIDSIQQLLDNNKTELLYRYFENPLTQLGELQSAYQIFAQSFFTFKNYLSNGFYPRKKNMIATDIANIKRLHNNLFSQKGLTEQDLGLSEKTFAANQSLKDDSVISALEYRNEKSKLINKQSTIPQINSSIINNESQQNEKQKEIIELENTIAQQKGIFQQALNTFKSQVDDWKKKYLLIAPINGTVAFAAFVQENQQLQANQTICFINPGNSEYYAQIVIPQSNFGKVASGQQVLLKFASYPFQEYGSVKGKIAFISHIPTDSGYLAKVVLTDGLNTNYKKQIQYRDGLVAQGEIITKDLRLLQRFYYGIVKEIN
jgi:multidrug efflux pump subunit AcrA (membrane-fusion protein)